MSEAKDLDDNIKLYRKLKKEADERVKKAVESVALSRQARRDEPDRQA